jgi:diaminobutyrate-2-oxoglutarate transaminase
MFPNPTDVWQLESNVRRYARLFPVVFDKGENSFLYDESGNEYIDFLSGAGSLNYGHNNPFLQRRLVDYILGDGIAHGLDFHTCAKKEFLSTFHDLILAPRGLDYIMQFPAPTGSDAVEAAFKLARKVTNRSTIVAFTNGYHGVTLGALTATGSSYHRMAGGVPLLHACHMPFDGYGGPGFDSIAFLEKQLKDHSGGIDIPAAFIVETVQGEGGLNTAGYGWLRRLQHLCRELGSLLIIDDIQAGCGRTGTFFSFEPADIYPDIVLLSKSLSGFGIPFSLVLLKPAYDVWNPGEHCGTFRGNNHAFVTASEALRRYWLTPEFSIQVQEKARLVETRLQDIALAAPSALLSVKGRGLMQGLACKNGQLADAIARQAFRRGLIIETCGPRDEVLKCLPPLTTTEKTLHRALDILSDSVKAISVSLAEKEDPVGAYL